MTTINPASALCLLLGKISLGGSSQSPSQGPCVTLLIYLPHRHISTIIGLVLGADCQEQFSSDSAVEYGIGEEA